MYNVRRFSNDYHRYYCSSNYICHMWMKMEYKRDIYILIACLVLYLLNQFFLKKMGIIFFNNYFNDLIAVPLYFALINIVSIHLSNKEINSFKILFIITIILSLLGEYVSIFVRKGSVTDYLDIICYFVGMMIYYLLKNCKKLNWRFINGFI